MTNGHTRRYELLLLTIPEITQDESEKLRGQISKIIAHAEGQVISWDRWGKFLLAYPVNDYEYGVYFLMRFDVPQGASAQVVNEIRHTFRVRFTQVVMRHMFQALDPDASLDYQRPESLEDKPQRDVSTFLKENKMTGLAESSQHHSAQPAESQEASASQEQASSQASGESETAQEQSSEQASSEQSESSEQS